MVNCLLNHQYVRGLFTGTAKWPLGWSELKTMGLLSHVAHPFLNPDTCGTHYPLFPERFTHSQWKRLLPRGRQLYGLSPARDGSWSTHLRSIRHLCGPTSNHREVWSGRVRIVVTHVARDCRESSQSIACLIFKIFLAVGLQYLTDLNSVGVDLMLTPFIWRD